MTSVWFLQDSEIIGLRLRRDLAAINASVRWQDAWLCKFVCSVFLGGGFPFSLCVFLIYLMLAVPTRGDRRLFCMYQSHWHTLHTSAAGDFMDIIQISFSKELRDGIMHWDKKKQTSYYTWTLVWNKGTTRSGQYYQISLIVIYHS